ncbi:hypothetical protein Btru_049744 [Bulinus truncatus]|nr:hypothetical protein Btru_049744 [Bulinus truncatus]
MNQHFKVPEFMKDASGVFGHFKAPEFTKDASDVFGIEVDKTIEDGYPTKVLEVHLKKDPRKRRAVKLFARNNSDKGKAATKYFHNEVTILNLLTHRYIMGVLLAGTFPTYHCMVMPYYEEGTLTKVLSEMHEGLIDHYFVQLCSALKYIHERNIIHRDIKTDNVLITDRNDIILADFGLSQILRPGESEVTGKKGTVIFRSPEQYIEASFNGFKADMYSLGVVLWCMQFKQDVLEDEPRGPLLYHVTCSRTLTRLDKTILGGLLDDQPKRRWDIHKLIDSLTDPRRFLHRIEKLRGERVKNAGKRFDKEVDDIRWLMKTDKR